MITVNGFVIEGETLKGYYGDEKDIVIPDRVTEIGTGAFIGNTEILSVRFPSTLKKIGVRAFMECSALHTVELPESLTYIGGEAFLRCKSLKEVTIPSGVKQVGLASFSECDNLHSVVISEGVTKICKDAFNGCSSIQSLFVPPSVTEIGEKAFSNCGGIKELILNKGLRLIKDGAFANCISIRNIIIPDTVTIIGAGAFFACIFLKEIIIPKSVQRIGASAFACDECIEKMVLEGVVEIGEAAFRGCKKLREVIVSDKLKYIRQNAFLGCQRLIEFSTEKDSFHKCIVIPGSVVDVDQKAFALCGVIQKVVIMGGCHIDCHVFYRCNMLGTVIIKGDTEIDPVAFRECRNLVRIGFEFFETDNLEKYDAAFNSDAVQQKACLMAIVRDLTSNIRKGTKYYSKVMTMFRVVVFDAICNSDVSLMQKLFSLVDRVSIYELDFYVEKSQGNAAIMAYLLEYKNSSYTIDEIEKYEDETLKKELGLMEKTVEDYEREYVFEYDGNTVIIEKYVGDASVVEIPSRIGWCRVVRVAPRAFYNNNSVVSVIVSKTVEQIGTHAFVGCENLQSVTILSKSTKIVKGAFADCPSLTIYGVSGSDAGKYAKANDIKFQKIN